jgi:glycosyltransferase involved in cell wall biosynthesis
MRRKLIIQTNSPAVKTGLAENGRNLAKYFHKSGKYEVVYYATQTSVLDPFLSKTPWKSIGSIPADQSVIQRMQQDQNFGRNVGYGAYFIDKVIKEEKPDLYLGSDDFWFCQPDDYIKKPWFNKINSILHMTADSLPILDLGFDQAKDCKNYFLWAKFGLKEFHNKGHNHVKQIYGALDINHFSPISEVEKKNLRAKFGISDKTKIIGFVFRNQLRKQANQFLQAFADFKKENPHADCKIHLHTSWSEKGNGWDIPKMIKYFGIKNEDVLCTYVCRNCGQWHVKHYDGEDINCPYCGAQKALVTASVVHGVPSDEMKFLYGLWDGGINPHSSGGLEINICNSMLCGLPTACTNYASGEDFCEQPFVTALSWEPYFEQGTNFIKSTTKASSIKNFIAEIYRSPKKDLEEIGEKSCDWAKKTFSIDTIGRQWEDVFEKLPPIDWSTISLEYKPKNTNYPFPNIPDNKQFIKALYKNILDMEVTDSDSGFLHWIKQLSQNVPRENIYQFFLQEATKENMKNVVPQDISVLFDKNNRKKILFVIKESGGDIAICTSLFKNLKELYENCDLYVACDPQFAEILEGNQYIYRTLNFHPIMEQEMVMKEYVDIFVFPALATQKMLAYLTTEKIGLELT